MELATRWPGSMVIMWAFFTRRSASAQGVATAARGIRCTTILEIKRRALRTRINSFLGSNYWLPAALVLGSEETSFDTDPRW
jgi:hypothetical protein